MRSFIKTAIVVGLGIVCSATTVCYAAFGSSENSSFTVFVVNNNDSIIAVLNHSMKGISCKTYGSTGPYVCTCAPSYVNGGYGCYGLDITIKNTKTDASCAYTAYTVSNPGGSSYKYETPGSPAANDIQCTDNIAGYTPFTKSSYSAPYTITTK